MSRFPELMTRAYVAGCRRVVFVVQLDESSTNVDSDWTAASGGVVGVGRSGEQAFAALVEKHEAARC